MINMTDDPRAALEIKRYHTWRTHHVQSVGEHSVQIMRILLTVWPACPRRLLIHAVTHDMGEMGGDIAYPFKKKFPPLKIEMDKVENFVKQSMSQSSVGSPEEVRLSPHEKKVFKLCEHIEMWEFGLCEMNMGNRYGELIADRMMKEIAATELEESNEHPGIPAAVHRYIAGRLLMEETK